MMFSMFFFASSYLLLLQVMHVMNWFVQRLGSQNRPKKAWISIMTHGCLRPASASIDLYIVILVCRSRHLAGHCRCNTYDCTILYAILLEP